MTLAPFLWAPPLSLPPALYFDALARLPGVVRSHAGRPLTQEEALRDAPDELEEDW